MVPLRGPGGFCIGSPRLTADIDATIAIALDDAEALVEDMSAEGFDSRVPDVERFAALTRVLPLTHRETGIPVDLVVAGPGLEEDFLRRARWIAIEGAQIPVIAPEDLVVTKMLAGRPKEIEDVRAILRERGGELDVGLVRESLRLLDEALDRGDLVADFESALGEIS